MRGIEKASLDSSFALTFGFSRRTGKERSHIEGVLPSTGCCGMSIKWFRLKYSAAGRSSCGNHLGRPYASEGFRSELQCRMPIASRRSQLQIGHSLVGSSVGRRGRSEFLTIHRL